MSNNQSKGEGLSGWRETENGVCRDLAGRERDSLRQEEDRFVLLDNKNVFRGSSVFWFGLIERGGHEVRRASGQPQYAATRRENIDGGNLAS